MELRFHSRIIVEGAGCDPKMIRCLRPLEREFSTAVLAETSLYFRRGLIALDEFTTRSKSEVGFRYFCERGVSAAMGFTAHGAVTVFK